MLHKYHKTVMHGDGEWNYRRTDKGSGREKTVWGVAEVFVNWCCMGEAKVDAVVDGLQGRNPE